MVLPWQNPVLLAEQAAVLDLMSGGRLDLGIGKGYRWNEFNGVCIPMEEAEARFDEALDVMNPARPISAAGLIFLPTSTMRAATRRLSTVRPTRLGGSSKSFVQSACATCSRISAELHDIASSGSRAKLRLRLRRARRGRTAGARVVPCELR
jgi:alkanesulfonate monooxygenase SsuD/methylene tetrahydromethanopterin reductase-like flavin-dependent oxidoreductase (luciferase family)